MTLADYGILIAPDKKDETDKPAEANPTPELQSPDELSLPERPKEAMNGSQFAAHLLQVEDEIEKSLKKEKKSPLEIATQKKIAREKEIYQQIKIGNIPSHLRKLKDVSLTYENEKGQTVMGKIKVMPDYISIGDEKDNLKVPMTPYTAQLIAGQAGCILPTMKIVNEIAKQAKVKIQPKPKPAGGAMTGTRYFIEHNDTIQKQLRESESHGDYIPGDLVKGEKKDIILPERGEGDTHVVIYGWFPPGHPDFQGYSYKFHENTYVDYSHGVRLVADYIKIEIKDKDGKILKTEAKKLSDVLADKHRYWIAGNTVLKNSTSSYAKNPWAKLISADSIDQVANHASSDKGIPIDRPSELSSPFSSVSATTDDEKLTPPITVEPAPSDYSAHSSTPRITTASQSAPISVSTPSAPSQEPSATMPSSPAGEPTSTPDSSPLSPSSPPEASPTLQISDNDIPPFKPASSAKEFLKINAAPPPIPGPCAFFGDSLNENISFCPYLKDQKHDSIAKQNMRTTWLKDNIPTNLKDFKYAVVMIGGNDIGGNESVEAIFERMKLIWQLIKEANKTIKLHVCTITPFHGYKYYDKNPAINRRRIELNELIRNEANKSGSGLRLIDLCLPLDQGGLADSPDDLTAGLHESAVGTDKIHPNQEVLARTYGRVIQNLDRKEAEDGRSTAAPGLTGE